MGFKKQVNRCVQVILCIGIIGVTCPQPSTQKNCTQQPIPGTTDVAVHCTVPILIPNITFITIPFNTIRTLSFTCSNGKALSLMEDNSFSPFVHVERLIIMGCKFESFPEDAFKGLKRLLYLRIQQSAPPKGETTLPHTFSRDTINIRRFQLNRNGIHTIPQQFWSHLPKVTSISLAQNQIHELKYVSNVPGCPTNLSTLDVSENLLTTLLSDDFHGIPSLIKLNLNKNLISLIHENTFYALQSLEQLDLSYNKLTNLHSTVFQHLRKLRYLYLFHNRIKALPSGIFDALINLETLNLKSNLLDFTNSSLNPFQNLGSLTELILSNCNIPYLPVSLFRGLNSLHTLVLGGNDLPHLNSTTFVPLQKLKYLSIEGSNLRSIDFLAYLPALIQLFMCDNKLLRPKYEDLSKCKNLETIDVGGNGITSLALPGKKGLGIFSNFTRLKFLKVNKNSLGQFDFFTVPTSVTYLDLTRTSIHYLNDELGVLQTKKVSTLMLSENRFQEWNNNSFGISVEEISCNKCVIETITTCTFCNLHKLKRITFFSSAVSRMERFAFRHTDIGSPTITPNVKFTSTMCNVAANWIVIRINFIHFRRSQPKYICQKTTQCRKTDVYQSHELKSSDSFAENVILDCGSNNISSFKSDFEERETITHLYLDNNKISVLLNGTFQNMTSLQYLYLNNSYITSMESDALIDAKQLTNLYLHNNEIQTLRDHQFINQVRLSVLWLQNNKITYLTRQVFTGQLYVQELRLDNNLLFHLRGNELLVLTSLSHLYLNSNKIAFIGYTAFRTQHNLQEIHLENNSIHEIHPRLFVGCRQLEILHLNANNFSIIAENTFGIPFKLKKLHLEKNIISQFHPLALKNLRDLQELNLEHNNLEKLSENTFNNNVHLKVLSLSHNYLQTILRNTFAGADALESLYLDNNNINNLNIEALSYLHNLKNVTLHNNQLTELTVWKLPPSLRSITLGGNNLTCDCSFLEPFQNWVIDNGHNKVADIANVFCKHDNGTRGELPILQYSQKFCQRKTSFLVPLLATGGAFVAFITVAILGYMHRLEMQVWVYSRYGVRLFYPHNDADAGKRYDGFVAFSTDDEEFVANHLVPGLEPDFRLCIHSRDFPVGAIITSTVCEVVENSCRTLLILTNHFINSEWCKYEFKVAHFQMIHDRCCRLIVIIVEDVDIDNMDKELKTYLKTNTYLRWGDPFFWEKLRFAMPDVKRLEELGERQPLLVN